MSDRNRMESSQYIYGSTVESAQPAEDVHKSSKNKKEVRKKRADKAQSKNARKLQALSVLFLSLAALCMVGICYYYLSLTAEMKQNVSEISSLEVQLADLKIENDYQLDIIKDSIDLDEIRDRAVNDLGMKEPSEGNIIGYDYNEDSYMRQYKDVSETGQTALLNYLD